MMPAIDSTPCVVGDDDHALVERVGLAVERQHAFAVPRAPHVEVALDLGEVEHMQRPAAIEGDVVGDVDERADRPEPDRAQPLLHPFRRRPVRHAAHQAKRESGAQMRVVRARNRDGPGRAVERAVDRLRRSASSASRGRRRRDRARCRRRPSHPDGSGVSVDVDHRIVEPGLSGVSDADRRVVRQFDDAVVIVAEFELRRRAQHAVRTRRRE